MSLAYETTALANGCVEVRSSDAKSHRKWFRMVVDDSALESTSVPPMMSFPGSSSWKKSVMDGDPLVKVPVLSKTTVVTLAAVSAA